MENALMIKILVRSLLDGNEYYLSEQVYFFLQK